MSENQKADKSELTLEDHIKKERRNPGKDNVLKTLRGGRKNSINRARGGGSLGTPSGR